MTALPGVYAYFWTDVCLCGGGSKAKQVMAKQSFFGEKLRKVLKLLLAGCCEFKYVKSIQRVFYVMRTASKFEMFFYKLQ